MNHVTTARAMPADMNPMERGHPTPSDLLFWVHSQIERGCVTITLRQRADDGEMLVSSWALPGNGVESIGAEIDARAQSEGRFLRGPTLFVLYAFKEAGREHVDRKTLRVEGDTFPKSGETEAPNLSGVTSMLMRHAEGATKIALGHTSHIIEQYKSMLAVAQRRITELEAALNETATMRDALVTMEHERNLAAHRARMEDKRGDFLREKLDLLFPIVAGKVLGQTPSGPPLVITDEAMKQLLGSFSNDQMTKLMSVLNPDQQMAMGDLYLRYAQRAGNAEVATAAKQNVAPTPSGSAANSAR